ncbi:MAG: hypothetical protein JO360_11290 [Acidobacteria bacterium]|nr:hypothetical protein [Acidobacteriota bacterium]
MTEDADRLSAEDDDEGQDVEGEMSEAEIDYNVMGTFPASDPPSWTLGIGRHRKPHDHFEVEELNADNPTHQNEPAAPDD